MSNSQPPKITVGIAGSTERTTICAEALRSDNRFTIPWILTPTPKILGRKKELTNNPLHSWATNTSTKTILLDKKIDDDIKNQLSNSETVDFLLVVDFGYLVPSWLLQLPLTAPLNVHPSLLPRWRGSSPGQFVLLYGEKESAVTVMIMNEALDEGPIIAQLPFTVSNSWTQKEYYQHSFALIKERLADLITDFANNKTATPQPSDSPTPIARRLSREDGFIEWQTLQSLISSNDTSASSLHLNSLLTEAASVHKTRYELVEHACRALSPWPGLWTVVTTDKGKTRMKLLSCHVELSTQPKLILEEVQLEGKQTTAWASTKHSILE